MLDFNMIKLMLGKLQDEAVNGFHPVLHMVKLD